MEFLKWCLPTIVMLGVMLTSTYLLLRSQPVYVAFTFDDGTIDHYKTAAPTLEKFGYRGVFSIIVNAVGKDGYMTWDMIRDLHRRGHVIASHTMNHQDLGQLYRDGRIDDMEFEISESKRILERELGAPVRYLCFPHGDHEGRIEG